MECLLHPAPPEAAAFPEPTAAAVADIFSVSSEAKGNTLKALCSKHTIKVFHHAINRSPLVKLKQEA
jgi:hypothetical protein